MPGSSSSQCKQIDEVTEQIAFYYYYVVDVLGLVNRFPSQRVEMAFKPAVPNHFGTMDQFHGRHFFSTHGKVEWEKTGGRAALSLSVDSMCSWEEVSSWL